MKNEQLNHIGLAQEGSELLTQKLSVLLANYSVFYQNVRGLHWNIQGKHFFELHLKFEELYSDLLLKMDELAERLLTLGGHPSHRFTDYFMLSEIKETTRISDGDAAVQSILDSFKILLVLQRKIQSMANEAGDEGTSAMMSDYIREQEKLVWMYLSYQK